MAAPTATADIQLDPKYDDYDYPIVAPVAQDGHPGHLTPEQAEKVKQLRTSLEGKGYTTRLDTLTLVCLSLKRSPWGLMVHRLTHVSHSCGSCVPASSTSLPPRQCKKPQPRRYTWNSWAEEQDVETEY